MFDLTVVALGGRWLLLDDDGDEVGAFTSEAEALKAAGDYARELDREARHVLIRGDAGEWDEAVVAPRVLH